MYINLRCVYIVYYMSIYTHTHTHTYTHAHTHTHTHFYDSCWRIHKSSDNNECYSLAYRLSGISMHTYHISLYSNFVFVSHHLTGQFARILCQLSQMPYCHTFITIASFSQNEKNNFSFNKNKTHSFSNYFQWVRKMKSIIHLCDNALMKILYFHPLTCQVIGTSLKYKLPYKVFNYKHRLFNSIFIMISFVAAIFKSTLFQQVTKINEQTIWISDNRHNIQRTPENIQHKNELKRVIYRCSRYIIPNR